MPEEKINSKAESKQELDIGKIKSEILEATKAQNEQFMKVILSTVNKKKEPEAKVESSKDLGDFKDEMEKLGIDEDGAKALISMMSKIYGKKSSKIKEEIKGEVKEDSQYQKKKERMEAEVAAKYPDILNKNSKLFNETSRIYDEILSDTTKKGSEATTIAVTMAAANLGIQPIDLSSVKAIDAINNTNSDGSVIQRTQGMTEKQKDFASLFKVDPKKFEKHLKQVQGKRM